MSHLHLNELSLICDMWVNKITYLLTVNKTVEKSRLQIFSNEKVPAWTERISDKTLFQKMPKHYN